MGSFFQEQVRRRSLRPREIPGGGPPTLQESRMPYTATVTQNNVQLPDGNLHQTGDKVLLSDEQYEQMGAAARAAVLSNVASINTETTVPGI